jgi:peroxiredoxin Q/BCP
MTLGERSGLAVEVGEPVPSIGLRASDGFLLNLRSFVTRQPIAFLFFGAPTLSGAARRRGAKAIEALVRGYPRLKAAGIEVVGVSCDSERQQADFAREMDLPFLLFSDERRSAVELLRIPVRSEGENFNVERPVLISVDAEGIIRGITRDPDPETLVDRILNTFVEPLPATPSPESPTAPPGA